MLLRMPAKPATSRGQLCVHIILTSGDAVEEKIDMLVGLGRLVPTIFEMLEARQQAYMYFIDRKPIGRPTNHTLCFINNYNDDNDFIFRNDPMYNISLPRLHQNQIKLKPG